MADKIKTPMRRPEDHQLVDPFDQPDRPAIDTSKHNKLKPREPRVPMYKRADTLYICATGYISRLRDLVTDPVALAVLDDFAKSMREFREGTEPRKARK